MSRACNGVSALIWSALPSSNWIVTIVTGEPPPLDGGGGPWIWQPNASGEDAVRSIAGCTVENDSALSRYLAVLPLNCAKTSLPSGGQARIPVSEPLKSVPFGPSTAAPARTGGDPSSDPTM